MRSTGEVMVDSDFGRALLRRWAGERLPLNGTVFVSMNDRDKVPVVVKRPARFGLLYCGNRGTCRILREHGLDVELVLKLHEGRPRPGCD